MPLENKDNILNASHPGRHAWVMANAGAGKTYLLTLRVLRLLLTGARPASILCLTFTKAAAAEMQERVQSALGKWATAEEDALKKELEELTGEKPGDTLCRRARALLATVLEAPDGLRIQTIHSFCQAVLSRFPLEADIPPHFEVMDERTAEELMREASLQLLSSEHTPEIADSLQQAVHFLAARYSEDQFKEILKNLRDNGRRLRSLLQGSIARQQALEAEIAHQRGVSIGDTPESVLAAHTYDLNQRKLLQAACDALSKSSTEQEAFSRISGWLAAPGMETWQEYLLFFYTGKGERRKKFCNQKTITDPAILECLSVECERVEATGNLLKAVEIVQATRHMLTLANALLALYARMKAQHALLDYDDLILATRDLLTHRAQRQWVLFKLDGGLDHLLVDEAQDTSPEQWEIVAALSEEFFSGEGARAGGRTLFVVGDEKQSIFGFQGADPRAFLNMHRAFEARAKAAGEELQNITLGISRRSGPAILQGVDAVFATLGSHVLSDKQTQHQVWEKLANNASSVELWPLVEAETSGNIDAWHLPLKQEYTKATPHLLARKIAQCIDGWLKEGKMLESQGRALTPGDIMILVTKRKGFVDPMTTELKRLRIPVASADRMVLNENLAVKDMLALAQFALLPDDNLNLACLLKSPLCNLNEEQLFSLAHDRKGSLWEALLANRDNAFASSRQFLQHMLARIDYVGPYEFFCEALYEQSGLARLLGRMGEEYREPVEELLESCFAYEQSHTPTMQGFVQWMLASEAVLKRDMENAAGKVRVMTVHAAKGLEAPVVLLANSSSLPGENQQVPKPLWFARDEGGSLPVWTLGSKNEDDDASNTRQEVRDEDYSEYIRLLYVGMTRARDTLIFTGWKNRKQKDAPMESWYGLVREALQPLMTPMHTPLGEGLQLQSTQIAVVKPQAAVGAVALARKPPGWLTAPPPVEPTPTRPLSPSRPAVATAAASPLEIAASLRRGTLIHQLFQHLPPLPVEKRAEAAEAFLKRFATEFSLAERSQMVDETLAVLEDARFAPLFSAQALAEVPVSGNVRIGAQLVTLSGQIDRLLITESEVWIVDFKTGRLPPASLEATPVHYVRQMAEYRALLQQIYPQHHVHCVLLWTAVPALNVLPRALFDAQALTAA